MPRNAEVIRQWHILLSLDKSRFGRTVDDLALDTGVGKRTIWRDMAALQEAGFPLRSEKRADGRTAWFLTAMPLKALQDPGLSATEVCSLYMSRALLASMPGAAFADGLAGLMKKIEKALAPRVREFLDQLPGVVKVKPGAVKKHAKNYGEIVARLIECSSGHRVAEMRYFSASSNREKDYVVHPYHVAYFDGGLYLTAWVPEYRQVRHFAAERIRTFKPTPKTFETPATIDGSPFAASLGVNDGRPERVEIEFAPRVARYIREREWHASQQLRDQPDGSVRLVLKVCRDWALRSWILGFGPHARVIGPSALAEEILEHLEEARDAYAPRLAFELPMAYVPQPRLPLR
ncbi:MAG: transcriptional regulator [Acidobacteria bacterium]|nr:transcriptional regulator [Acidobacteriota bacterium]